MTEPLQTYTLLLAAIQTVVNTNNTSVLGNIPTFMYLVEQELNRRYIPPAAWSRRTHTIASESANARYITLPPETVRVTRVHLDSPPYEPLQQLSPSGLMNKYPNFDTGRPKAFSILGEVIELSHVPDDDYTIEIVSRQRIWPLRKDISNVDTSKYQSHVTATSAGLVESNYWTLHAADLIFLGALKNVFRDMKDERLSASYAQAEAQAHAEFDRYVTAKSLTADHGVSTPQGVMIV